MKKNNKGQKTKTTGKAAAKVQKKHQHTTAVKSPFGLTENPMEGRVQVVALPKDGALLFPAYQLMRAAGCFRSTERCLRCVSPGQAVKLRCDIIGDQPRHVWMVSVLGMVQLLTGIGTGRAVDLLFTMLMGLMDPQAQAIYAAFMATGKAPEVLADIDAWACAHPQAAKA